MGSRRDGNTCTVPEKDHLKPIAEQVARPLHDSLVSNRRIMVLGERIASLIPPGSQHGVDVGAGDGAVCKMVQSKRPDVEFTGVDVLVRDAVSIPVKKFDGVNLPFDDNSFDFCMLIDVLHHTTQQYELLSDCLRVARKFVIIKDHLCENGMDRLVLSFMDWVGNKAHGVDLPYNYLSSKQWQELFDRCHVQREQTIERIGLYPAPASIIFEANLHFMSRLATTDTV